MKDDQRAHLSFRCPDCHLPLTGEPLHCANGHSFGWENGVLVLLSSKFRPKLEQFLTLFQPHRATIGRRITNPAIYERLPAGLRHDPEWRQRVYDLAVIENCLSRTESPLRILEIGAYNGWLSNRLARLGHQVIAVDEFSDPYDGLGAHQFYAANWLPVQADTRDLSVFADLYDAVVLNRCTQFFLEPVSYVAQAMDRVAQGGVLILLGMAFFRNSAPKAAAVAANYAELAEKGMQLFKPNKGYLDFDDKRGVENLGIALKPYPQLRMKLVNWRARLQPQRAAHYWGSYRKW